MHQSSIVGVINILVISLEAAQHAVKLIVVCVVVMFCCVVFTNLLIFWSKKIASHKFYKVRENAP